MTNITRTTTLPSGLRVATCSMPHATSASMAIWAGVGSRHEDPHLNGISHFIEHMLFKGTARRSARRIMQDVEGVGGDINAFTSEERTCYHAASAAEFFPRIADVLCDIYSHPRFARADIELERGVISEEILMYHDEPSSRVHELLQSAMWRNHPLGRPITGTLETIATMGAREFQAYRHSHYNAATTVITAAGRLDHDHMVDTVGRHLATVPAGALPKPRRFPPPPRKPRIVAEARDIQQTQLCLALPSFGQCHPARHAAGLLNVILGANASSRLFQQLRERRGLCYTVGSHITSLTDGACLVISAGLDRANLAKSLALILAEFESLRSRHVGAAELRRAKEFVVGSSRMALERSQVQAMRLGGALLAHNRIDDPETVHARIRAVDADAIRDAARHILDPSRITLAVVGPNPDTPSLHTILS
jgi:predicted Zn-dependent peptidase